MKINMDYERGLAEINHMLTALPPQLQDKEKELLRKSGAIIKKRLKRYLHSSGIENRAKKVAPSNHDGSRPYKHLADDIVYSTRRDANGNLYVSVRGGPLTGYKWHLVNDGHFSRDGATFVQGIHFMDKALQSSEGEINALVDQMLREVLQ